VSGFFNGARLFRLEGAPPSAELIWKGSSDSAIDTDGLHALMATPVFDGEHIYGVCSFGQLRCLRAADGSRVWETQHLTKEKARNASAFLVRHGDRFFINNDRGELIIAKLSPVGYEESHPQFVLPGLDIAGEEALYPAPAQGVELLEAVQVVGDRFPLEFERDRIEAKGFLLPQGDEDRDLGVGRVEQLFLQPVQIRSDAKDIALDLLDLFVQAFDLFPGDFLGPDADGRQQQRRDPQNNHP
jgi:hypothetical protein